MGTALQVFVWAVGIIIILSIIEDRLWTLNYRDRVLSRIIRDIVVVLLIAAVASAMTAALLWVSTL